MRSSGTFVGRITEEDGMSISHRRNLELAERGTERAERERERWYGRTCEICGRKIAISQKMCFGCEDRVRRGDAELLRRMEAKGA
jgi:uncharacterized OB-fold protein